MKVVLSIISSLSLLALTLAGTNGCKKHDSDSSVKNVSVSVRDAIGFDSLDPPERETICKNHTMIVYIGNAESMGTLEYSPDYMKDAKKIAALTATQKKKDNTYFRVIKQGGYQLYKSLQETQCDSYTESAVSLLRIIDGPGSKDSQILLTKYAFKSVPSHMKTKEPTQVWSVIERVKYAYAGGKLETLTKAKKFELNLPASVENIVKTVMDDLSKKKEVTQVIYFIKSHGGLVSTQRESKSTGFYDFAGGDAVAKVKPENLKHVLLFDSHGEDGKTLESEVYSYMWSKNSSCELMKKDPAKYKDLMKSTGCDVTTYKECSKKYEKNPAHCKDLYPQVAIGKGQGDGGEGQGDGNDGQGDGGEGQGDGGEGQGDGGEGQGDGGEGQGDGGEGQGPGKQMMFLTSAMPKPEMNGDAKPAADKPDWTKKIGAMATYDLETTDGKSWDKNITQLKLPLPENPKSPTMIVLDSCYGADEIFNAAGKSTGVAKLLKVMKDMVTLKSRKDHAIVTLSNPKPTYYYTVNYNILDATGYLAIPNIFYWEHTGDSGSTDQVPVIAQSLRAALLNPTIEDRKNLVERFGKLEKKVENVDDDWMALQPAVFIIKK